MCEDNYIAELEATIADREAEIRELQHHIARLEDQVDSLSYDLANR